MNLKDSWETGKSWRNYSVISLENKKLSSNGFVLLRQEACHFIVAYASQREVQSNQSNGLLRLPRSEARGNACARLNICKESECLIAAEDTQNRKRLRVKCGDVEIKHIEKVHAVDNGIPMKFARSSCWQVVKRNAPFLKLESFNIEIYWNWKLKTSANASVKMRTRVFIYVFLFLNLLLCVKINRNVFYWNWNKRGKMGDKFFVAVHF